MNWLNKLERKFGRYAVPNLIVYLIGAYSVGFVLNMVAPNILGFLNFQPYYILHGQIWRLITWILMPTDSNIIFLLIMMLFYYQLGTALERAWGTFRFNAYIIGGILLTEVGSLLAYGLIYLFMGGSFAHTASTMMGQMISTSYINMSIFLAFATLYPDMQVLLYFIIPIKMKWMAAVYVVIMVFSVWDTYHAIYAYTQSVSTALWYAGIMLLCIVMSLLNYLIFFLSTRNLSRYTPHEVHRRQQFKAQMREPRVPVSQNTNVQSADAQSWMIQTYSSVSVRSARAIMSIVRITCLHISTSEEYKNKDTVFFQMTEKDCIFY